jgi:hypothetical protein
MKKALLLVLIVLLVVCLNNCITYVSHNIYSFNNIDTINKPQKLMMKETIQFLLSKGLTPTLIDKENGLIIYRGHTNQFYNIVIDSTTKRQYRSILDCGYDYYSEEKSYEATPDVSYYNYSIEIAIFIIEGKNNSSEIDVYCRYYDILNPSRKEYQCVSTGKFEKALFEYLEK